jgi:hypothetical protein
VKGRELLKTLQTEIARHNLSTFTNEKEGIVEVECSCCKKRFGTIKQFKRHLNDDVLCLASGGAHSFPASVFHSCSAVLILPVPKLPPDLAKVTGKKFIAVGDSPLFDHDLRLLQGIENLFVQAFIPQLPIETFTVAVLPRTARHDDCDFYWSVRSAAWLR